MLMKMCNVIKVFRRVMADGGVSDVSEVISFSIEHSWRGWSCTRKKLRLLIARAFSPCRLSVVGLKMYMPGMFLGS